MLYQNGMISVDYDFARFGAKSYAVNKINTVDVVERRVRGKGLAMALLIIAGFGLISAVGGGGLGAIVLTALFGIPGGLLLVRPDVYEYDLFLRTSSSEGAAFKTRDRDEIVRLREAIEAAITGRAKESAA